MTVAELIKVLRGLPADLPVLVQGYETGWDGIHTIEVQCIERYRKAQPWDGEYQDGSDQSAALIIGRREAQRR